MRVKLVVGALILATLLANVAAFELSVDGIVRTLTSPIRTLTRPFFTVYSRALNWGQQTILGGLDGGSKRISSRMANPVNPAGPLSDPRARASATTREGNGSSDGDGSNPLSGFDSRCFFSRGPNFRKPPKLYVFTSETHTPGSLGCNPERAKQVQLKLIGNPDTSTDSDTDFDQPQMDRDAVRMELLDTGIFSPNVPTYFLIHGFLSSWNADNWMCAIKDLLLNSSSANVFIVDWSGGAKPMLPIDYSASVSNTRYVGALLGEFVNTLVEMTGQGDASQYHMIGHSLGAQICGFAGYYIGSLGRITGLDPAGPCFGSDSHSGRARDIASSDGSLSHGKRRLSPESAEFVTALHTDAGLFGLNENCAHYDIYVNGGYKQPKCASSSLTDRFEDLIRLNLGATFDLGITCAHSYSQKLLNSYIEFVHGSLNGQRVAGNQQSRNQPITGLAVNGSSVDVLDHCLRVAYECDDWQAFKAGECGFCRDDDTKCVYTSLSSYEFQATEPINLNFDLPNDTDSDQDSGVAADDDDQFNDENDNLDDDDDPKQDDPNRDATALEPSRKNTKGRHFMRAGIQGACLLHYQIIVAAKRSDIMAIEGEGRYYYYLQLPLELSGTLTDSNGGRLKDRLVQVSHKLRPGSRAFEALRMGYIGALRQQNANLTFDESNNIDFYTALISFQQVPQDLCTNDVTNGASRKDYWQICKPLRNIQEASLWSSSEQKLNAVVWVALNYMSSVSYRLRMANSYLLKRGFEEVKSREDVESRPQLQELSPKKSKSLRSLSNGAVKSAGCLLSLLDTSDESDRKRNFRCNRSGKELKYTIRLDPVRLG